MQGTRSVSAAGATPCWYTPMRGAINSSAAIAAKNYAAAAIVHGRIIRGRWDRYIVSVPYAMHAAGESAAMMTIAQSATHD